MDPSRQLDFNLHLLGCVIIDRGYFNFTCLGCLFHRVNQGLSGEVVGKFGNGDGFVVFLFNFCAAAQATIAVVIFGYVDNPTLGKVGIEGEFFSFKILDLAFEQVTEIMGHDLGGHANGNTFGPKQEEKR